MALFNFQPTNAGNAGFSEDQSRFMKNLDAQSSQSPEMIGSQTHQAIEQAGQQSPESHEQERATALGMSTPAGLSQAIRARAHKNVERDVNNLQRQNDIQSKLLSANRVNRAAAAHEIQYQNDVMNYHRQMDEYNQALGQRANAISGVLGVMGSGVGMAMGSRGGSSPPAQSSTPPPAYTQQGYNWNQEMPERGF